MGRTRGLLGIGLLASACYSGHPDHGGVPWVMPPASGTGDNATTGDSAPADSSGSDDPVTSGVLPPGADDTSDSGAPPQESSSSSAGSDPPPSEPSIALLGRLDPRPPLNYYDNETGEGDIYNGIWGYASGGKEYALLTGGRGLSVIDVTEPTAPQEVHFHPMTGGDIHRDVVVVGDYAFVGAQEGGRLEIIDLGGLPASISSAAQMAEYTDDTHTIDARGDIVILNSAIDGCRILDASDPASPTLLSTYWNGNDCHDSAVVGDRLFVAGGYEEFYDVVDFSNPSAPTMLGRTDAVSGIYAHSVAVSEDGATLYAFEEFNAFDILVYDVSDAVTPQLLTTWQWPSEAIVHNGVVRGDYLLVAYYESGFAVVDVSDPANPRAAVQYITYPPPDEEVLFAHPEGGFFNGAWNVYVDLPSGVVLVSDMLSGLFVFEVELP